MSSAGAGEAWRFVAVAEGGGPAEGRCLAVVVEGRGLAIFRVGGTLRAVTDRCPHNGMPLRDGELRGGVLTCRWHGWSFDLETGLPPGADPDAAGPRVCTYPVRAVEGRVWVGLPAERASREARS